MRLITIQNLKAVQNRLSNLNISAEIAVVRAETPGEYHCIVLEGDNFELAMANLVSVRKMLTNLPSNAGLVLEIGFAGLQDKEYPIIEIRPRFSYLLESEREALGLNTSYYDGYNLQSDIAGEEDGEVLFFNDKNELEVINQVLAKGGRAEKHYLVSGGGFFKLKN
jgi:hypothetical protein